MDSIDWDSPLRRRPFLCAVAIEHFFRGPASLSDGGPASEVSVLHGMMEQLLVAEVTIRRQVFFGIGNRVVIAPGRIS